MRSNLVLYVVVYLVWSKNSYGFALQNVECITQGDRLSPPTYQTTGRLRLTSHELRGIPGF
jgi:hypothetical protein